MFLLIVFAFLCWISFGMLAVLSGIFFTDFLGEKAWSGDAFVVLGASVTCFASSAVFLFAALRFSLALL